MELDEYQAKAKRTMNRTDLSYRDLMANIALGLAGETGELVDYLKKVLFHGHKASAERIADECGDCLWYLSAIAQENGLSLEYIARKNIEKLRLRYPNGFSAEDSMNRKETR